MNFDRDDFYLCKSRTIYTNIFNNNKFMIIIYMLIILNNEND